MPAVVIDVQSADDPRDVVHRAVQALAEGKLVAFPTETVYGLAASALCERGVERLLELARSGPDGRLSLVVKSADDAFDYVPTLCPLGKRLARRCWPGPIALRMRDEHPDSLLQRLPSAARQAVLVEGWIEMQVPAHRLVQSVTRLIAGPLLFTSHFAPPAAENGAKPAGEAKLFMTGQQVFERLGESIDLILEDGPSQFGQLASVVCVDDRGWQLVGAGVVSEANLKRLSSYMLLLVCTGNTCRSPMAELLARKQIAARLGCALEELEDRGVMILSAGLSAMPGARPSPEAVQVLAEQGLDLSSHASQPLSELMVKSADLILTMTRGHRDAILAQWPQAADRTVVLSPDGIDVSDPIGGPKELYAHCAEQIEALLERRLEEIDWETVAGKKKEA